MSVQKGLGYVANFISKIRPKSGVMVRFTINDGKCTIELFHEY